MVPLPVEKPAGAFWVVPKDSAPLQLEADCSDRSSTNSRADITRPSEIAKKLLKPSWQEVKSALRMTPRKQSAQNGEAPSKLIDHRRETSPWELVPGRVKERILLYLEWSRDHFTTARTQQYFRNDLIAVQLSCIAWSGLAQKHLYESIRLKPRHDQHWYSPHSDECRTRIVQLRSVLRANPRLGALVKHLVLLPERHHHERHHVHFSDVVASVVMACPNLETLSTHHSPYTHSFDKLVHALSTRSKLKHHAWLIGEDPSVQSRASRHYRAGMLSNQQTQLFLQHHSYWQDLESMNLVSYNGRGVLEHTLLVKVLNMLPSLKRLQISSFDSNDFSDDTLLSLPPLESLTLNRCHGISETGLCRWAQSPAAVHIRKLVLESQHITSLLTISGLLESLPSIEAFRVFQLEFEPGLPLELEIEHPLFHSTTLRTLEWYTASGNHYDQTVLRNKLPEHFREQAQMWPRSKSSLHILCSVLEYAFPHLQKLILPGYDNLNGLLKWVRHTSWQNTGSNTASSARRAVVSAPPSPKFSVLTKRNTTKLSLRPASPSFYEYNHWRKSPLSHSPLRAATELPTIVGNGDEEEEGYPSPPMSIPCTNSATTSPTHSNFRSSEDGSTMSSVSSHSMCPQEISRFSTDTIDEEEHEKHQRHHATDVSHSTTRGSDEGYDPVRQSMDRFNAHSRHSSISVLLDGYDYYDTYTEK